MGHLVDQVEVAALETRVSKSSVTTTAATTTSTIITTSSTASSITTAAAATTATTTQATVQQPSQQNLLSSQYRPVAADQNQSKPKQRKLQFKLNDEGSPDKKPKERIEEEGFEEDDSGWWADRVAMAFGGMTEYRDNWYRSHAHLLHGDGPLPHTWRLYIAALAVCRHEVSWLMQALLADFTYAGGDIRWTVGLHHAPPKLYALTSINNILAHRPWLLSPQHIQQLTKGEDSWSLGELCQALCIMTHFHTLATFLHGCRLSSLHAPSKKDDGQGNSSKSVISNKGSPRNIQTRASPDPNPQNNNSTSGSGSNGKPTSGSTSESSVRSYKHLTVNPTYSYVEAVCDDDSRVPSFYVQEYNWQDHGYAMCSRLLGDVGALFDDRFKSSLALVVPGSKDHCPQSSSVDQLNNALCDQTQGKLTPLPAKALWNHVQWLLGIHRDDCDYNDLNKHLDPQMRAFIKTACCFPETLADTNLSPVTTSSVQTSMVETSVIVMEARLQAELLYALRAIMLHHC